MSDSLRHRRLSPVTTIDNLIRLRPPSVSAAPIGQGQALLLKMKPQAVRLLARRTRAQPPVRRLSSRGLERDRIQESADLRASDPAAQKVRRQEQGHQYVEARLIALGAPVPRAGCDPAVWLREALTAIGTRSVRHRGAHRFIFPLGQNRRQRARTKIGIDARPPYPRRPDSEPAAL
ncbi:hypothetical protein [Streptomyces griseomycini]|uniref:Uncharacterized protein n=1 Tax=Streptomyces griseomycini TaxID=66895 RepID=A0A7W7PWX6_9ACTN|nr:hypothetical protein [Streptomyces griseomycini]MBB4902748.1 hypothetical protein [Streptomyces griseomycini]